MRVLLHSDADLTLREVDQPGIHVELAPGAHADYGAVQLLAVSLGLCTASVLMGYGEQLGVSAHQLTVRLRWTLAEKPRRVDALHMDIHWPELPESRLRAAERATAHCTIHNTLHHPPTLRTTVTR